MGAPKSLKNSVVLAVLQNAVGVPGVPTGADDAFLVSNVDAKPISAEYVSRDFIRPYYGNSEQLSAAEHAEIDFEIELSGSGEAGTPPKWGRMLIASNFTETVTAGEKVVYAPVSNVVETPLTIYYYLDGLLHRITDARGTVSWDFTVKKVPTMKFHLVGAYNPVTDTPLPANTDFSKIMRPKVARTGQTTWSMHAYTGALESATMDVANTLNWASLIGSDDAEITDRKPTGKIVLQLPSVAEKDWWQTSIDATLGAFNITHGTVAGNIVKIDAPSVQLTNLTYSDQDSKVMLNADMTINPVNGNDELVITAM
ncbi:phage tail tube protein [Burkholderia gladioli]|uniref:phage tail tube protein n=1 Tax=Burkholderia gladioli TaxID=28095 RepID=UPI0016416ED5|nr:phage tail tube protein [Burkholderia gladioli]